MASDTTEYHWILALQRPGITSSREGTVTIPPGATRQDAYREVRRMVESETGMSANDYAVTFFTLDRNQL